ncbi:MAG: response regulator, partial [Bacteroidales bacterium]
PATVVGDPMRLRQIVVNLVGNAIKFTEKGSVTLTVERIADAAGAPWLRLAVTDTGIGIGEDGRKRLFNRYSQAAAWVSRKFGGTGLGLSICQQLVELMGGEIGVDSELGRGSTFWLQLPLVATAEDEPRARPYHRPARVLLVDTDDAVRQLLARTLEGWGIATVAVAADGIDAVKRPGDVLLVGARMACAAAQALATACGLPAVILSAAGTVVAPDHSGSTVVLAEPVREAALAAALDWLSLPAGQRQPAPAGRISGVTAAPRPALPGLSVLVVEDNPVNRRVAVAMLERLGHTVAFAEDGAEALAAVRATSFDFVLMDRHMPVMDGVEAVRAIRCLPPPACNVPVVALTAAATQDEVLECLAAGMDDFISKPFTPEQLTAVAARILAARHGEGNRDYDPTHLDVLRQALGEDSVAELLPQFYSTAQASLAALASATAMRDGKAMAEHAHDLKGAGGQVGLVGLHRLCAAIETAIREGRLTDATTLADQVPAAYARGRAWLRRG